MKTSFNYSSNPELSGITQEVITVTHASDVPEIASHPLFAEVERLYAPYHDVVMRETYMGMGEEIRRLNQGRISASNTLKAIVKGYAKFSNEAKSGAAKAIMAEWAKLGNTRTMNDYDVANAYMKKVIDLLKSPQMAPHIATLSLADELADVEASEKKFQDAFAIHTTGNAALREEESASARRPQMAKALGNYLKFINAMRSVPPYDVLYTQLNEVVKTAKRATKKQKEE